MGAANIAEKHITTNMDKIWTSNLVSKIPSVNISTQTFNKSFVSLAMIVGAVTVIHSTKYLIKKGFKAIRKPKLLTKSDHQQKYGIHSYAVITDCKNSQDWIIYLAKNGYNFILMGLKENIQYAKANIISIDRNLDIVQYPIDWSKKCMSLETYDEDIPQLVQKYDVSILLLPKYEYAQGQPSNNMELPNFQVPFLMTRALCNKMGWRQNKSAIIVQSHPKAIDQTVQKGKGVIKGCDAALDSFGRAVNYQFSEISLVEVIVARGSPENAFALLGHENVSL